MLGWISLSSGDYSQASRIFEEMLATSRSQDDRPAIIWALAGLARIATANGDFDLADQLCQEVDLLGVDYSNGFSSHARYAHALLAIVRREYELALERLKFLADHWFGDTQILPIQLLIQIFGILAEAQDQHQRAAVLFGAQDFIARNLMNISSPREREEYQQALAAAKAGLGENGFARAMDQGRALSLEEAIQYAVEDSE